MPYFTTIHQVRSSRKFSANAAHAGTAHLAASPTYS